MHPDVRNCPHVNTHSRGTFPRGSAGPLPSLQQSRLGIVTRCCHARQSAVKQDFCIGRKLQKSRSASGSMMMTYLAVSRLRHPVLCQAVFGVHPARGRPQGQESLFLPRIRTRRSDAESLESTRGTRRSGKLRVSEASLGDCASIRQKSGKLQVDRLCLFAAEPPLFLITGQSCCSSANADSFAPSRSGAPAATASPAEERVRNGPRDAGKAPGRAPGRRITRSRLLLISGDSS